MNLLIQTELSSDTKVYEDSFAKIWLHNGIVYFEYKPEVTIDYDAQVKHTEIRNQLSGGKARPVFSDTRGVRYWTREAKKYSNSEEATQYISAVAIIINSVVQKISWNWAVKIFKIKTPAKLFTINEKDEAMNWLQQYK